MKISLLQLKIKADPEENVEKVINKTKNLEGRVILLPEMFTTSFDYSLINSLDEKHPEILKNLPDNNIYMGSIYRKTKKGKFNSFFIKDGQNISFPYDKLHLFPLMEEDKYLTPGERLNTFTLKNILCAAGICFDIRFPEMFRYYFKNNTSIVFIPTEWPSKRIKQLIRLVRARAVENQCFYVMCNAAGKSAGHHFGGMSAVLDPLGNNLNKMTTKCDELISTEIDINKISIAKSNMEILNHIRKDIYC
ncbi:MAG: nitrilase [Flexistipes sinusarabici]|uniref:Nitrilase n=1 Tax=Flexistipes sinusarabici TaxID=2352 RepID=A0A5D0MNU0_FLESI|nr:nitrilase-related carbon-nitrogen hydrolase [Flexistipes sinusarabici]TYB32928.1 MAG: nitrilase [Flexistipes sinusarabici]